MLFTLITVLVMRLSSLRHTLRENDAHWLGGYRSNGGLIHNGGYSNEVLSHFVDGPFDVWSMSLNDKDFDLEEALGLIDKSIDANVHKGKLKLVFGTGTEWHDDYRSNGLVITDVPKGGKRHGDILAPRPLVIQVDLPDILEVDMTPYHSPLVNGESPEELEKLYDGGFIVNRDFVFDPAVDAFEARLRSGRWTFANGSWVQSPTQYSEFEISSRMARFKRTIMANTRVIAQQGLLKGNAMMMPDAKIIELFGKSYDVVVPKGQWKKGVQLMTPYALVTMDPQEWHNVEYTNDQARINLRAMNTDQMRQHAAKTYLGHLREAIKNGTLLDGVANVVQNEAKSIVDEKGQVNWKDLSIRYSAAEWVARGLNLRDSESLLRGAAEAKGSMIMTKDNKVKIPQQCGWHMQLIPETLARFFGFGGKTPVGYGRVWWPSKMVIASDVDYLENYDNWGGPDSDDLYEVMFRTYEKIKSIIPTRSPKGWGEYVVLKFYEGDKFPTFKELDGSETSFPEVKGKLPKKLSEALMDGSVEILPLDKDVEGLYTELPLTRDDVKDKLKKAVSIKASAGMLVNAVMLYALVFEDHLPIGYGKMEDYIDWTTQEDLSPDSAARLEFFARYVVNYVVHSGKAIDKKFYDDRNFANMLVPTDVWKKHGFQKWMSTPDLWKAPDALNTMSVLWARYPKNAVRPTPNLVTEGKHAPINIQWEHVKQLLNEFLEFARKEAQKAQPPVGLEELGTLRLGEYGDTTGFLPSASEMSEVLRDFRVVLMRGMFSHATAEFNAGRREIDSPNNEEWDKLFNDTYDLITINKSTNTEYEITEQYNRVLALGLASYKHRTSNWWCQYDGCTYNKGGRASQSIKLRGKDYQFCRRHAEEVQKDLSLLKTKVKEAKFTDIAVINRAVFPLYMEAMEYYGLAARLEHDLRVEDIGYANDIECKLCGATHTYEWDLGGDYSIAKRYQNFLSNEEICGTCLNAIEAHIAMNP